MKILITTDAYSAIINGVTTSIKNLRKELINMGHEVKILTLSNNKYSYTDFDDNVIYLGSYDISRIYPDARVSKSYSNTSIQSILEWKPDIIHSQSEFTTFYISKKISKKLNIPLVHTYHTLYEEYTHYFSPSERVGKIIARRFTKFISKKSACMIVPTSKTEAVLHRYGIRDNLYIVPTGLSMEKFKNKYSVEELNILKEDLNVPTDKKILISVGRVGKEKNIEELIEYINKSNLENIHFVIVGDGPNRENLENMIDEYNMRNIVTFTGLIPNDQLNIYYQMADVFLSASTSETQGLTYVEALANNIPIICRNDTCLEETVVNDFNGYRYNSYEEFYEKLNLVLKDDTLYEKLSINSKLLAEEKFSSKTFASRILDIYRNYL